MSIKNTLHKISHLKWGFLIAAIILIVYSFIILPENLISIIGTIIFLVGIHLGLDSMRDIEKMSEREKNNYKNSKLVKKLSIIILSSISVLIIISLLFLSLKFVFPSNNTSLFTEFFNLGLDCWAFILGLLCLLKSTFDRQNFVKSL